MIVAEIRRGIARPQLFQRLHRRHQSESVFTLSEKIRIIENNEFAFKPAQLLDNAVNGPRVALPHSTHGTVAAIVETPSVGYHSRYAERMLLCRDLTRRYRVIRHTDVIIAVKRLRTSRSKVTEKLRNRVLRRTGYNSISVLCCFITHRSGVIPADYNIRTACSECVAVLIAAERRRCLERDHYKIVMHTIVIDTLRILIHCIHTLEHSFRHK